MHEETWCIVDGGIEFRVGEGTFEAAPVACVFVPPRARPARLSNRTEAPARFLLIV